MGGYRCPTEHPSVTHRRIVENVHRGMHPAQATRHAYHQASTRRFAPPVIGGHTGLQSRADALMQQFVSFYGGHARIEIGATSGALAEAFPNGDGSATIRIDPRVPDYALPAVVGHEMGHVLQMALGPIAGGPPTELEATRIAGDFLRRGGYALEDGLRSLRDGGAGSAIHGTLQQQLDAMTRGYYDLA